MFILADHPNETLTLRRLYPVFIREVELPQTEIAKNKHNNHNDADNIKYVPAKHCFLQSKLGIQSVCVYVQPRIRKRMNNTQYRNTESPKQ